MKFAVGQTVRINENYPVEERQGVSTKIYKVWEGVPFPYYVKLGPGEESVPLAEDEIDLISN